MGQNVSSFSDYYDNRRERIFVQDNARHKFIFDLQDEVANYNLCELLREDQRNFYVDGSGRLQRVESLYGRIKHKFQGDKKVREVIHRTLLKLAVSDEIKTPCGLAFIKHFFNPDSGLIGRLNRRIFNPDIFEKDDPISRHYLKRDVLRIKLGQNAFYEVKSKELGGQILDLDLKDEVTSEKFVRLLKRQKVTATAENIQKICDISIKNLEKLLNQTEITQVHQFAIKKIFHESGLKHLTRNEFYRGSIEETSVIEKILVPELEARREDLVKAKVEVAEGRNDGKLDAVEDALLEYLYTEFLFAQKLGIDLERNHDGGSGGARYARDRKGEKILVFKPDDEGPNKQYNPQSYSKIKNFFVSPKGCLDGNSEALAEARSYLLNRKFGFRLVPPTMFRFVHSADFKGKQDKLCSVQAYVKGCQTLREVLGISPWMQALPRPILKWWLQREKVEITDANGQRKLVPKVLLKIPQNLLEKIGIHNGLIEDIDCHFENILFKLHEKETPPLLHAIFKDPRAYSDRTHEIRAFVSHMIETGGHQALLDVLLASDKNLLGEIISLIKHDGGSSFPHKHPTGHLSTRFKHLFEVLPHFDEVWPSETCKSLFEKEGLLESFLLDLTVQSLRMVLFLDDDIFTKFWSVEKNRELVREWIFHPTREKTPSFLSVIYSLIFGPSTADDTDFNKYRIAIISELMKAAGRSTKKEDETQQQYEEMNERYGQYFEDHLRLIKGSVQTRMDSWRIMKAFAQSGRPMRDFFRGVRSEKAFEKELRNLGEDGFPTLLKKWRATSQPAGLLIDLGT